VRFCAQEGVPPLQPFYEDRLYSVYAEIAGKPKGRAIDVLRDVIIADSDDEAMALWQDSGQFSGRAWGFLPKLFRLQSNSPRRHDMLNDHPRFLHHDAIYHQLQYLLLHLEGRLLKRPTHTGTKCFRSIYRSL